MASRRSQDRRWPVMMLLVASTGLFPASDDAAFCGNDVVFSALRPQPVVLERVERSGDDYLLFLFNRSSKTIHEIVFVFAGQACTPPYKPVWPGEKRDDLVISPGASISIRVSKSVIDGVAARSLASCGHTKPTEIGVVHVSFADGSNWALRDQSATPLAEASVAPAAHGKRHTDWQ